MEGIPQIVTIATVSTGDRLNLKKASRQHQAGGRRIEELRTAGMARARLRTSRSRRYNHPASKAAIMGVIPWITEPQNEDGPWGEKPRKDALSLVMLSVLVSVGIHLPRGLRP
jgi:hypothetical protein